MTWTKLGDEWADAADELSDAAFRTHIEALGYSNRMLADLLIPKRALHRFAGTTDPEKAAAQLVDQGWWEDRDECWWIGVHFPEWQRDRAQVQHRRQIWADSKLRQRRHALGDHGMCLPKNCPAARQSTEDNTEDVTDEST